MEKQDNVYEWWKYKVLGSADVTYMILVNSNMIPDLLVDVLPGNRKPCYKIVTS